MILSEKEFELFSYLHIGLCIYVGEKYKLLSPNTDFEDYFDRSPEIKIKIRDKLIQKIGLIDDYVKENPQQLNQEEIDICLNFKNCIYGDFFVLKYLKKHTIFLSQNMAYGVLGLTDPIEFVLHGMKPVRVKAFLLPFKDKIVYDGLMQSYNVYFGGNFTNSLNREYNLAKSKTGIVTSLPFKAPKIENEAELKLDIYMKNAKNREYYYYEIEELLDNNPHLEPKYYWLWGKVNSRGIKKNLKDLGISNLHYAVAIDTVIAMAESDYQVKEMVKAILSKEKQEWVYYFKI